MAKVNIVVQENANDSSSNHQAGTNSQSGLRVANANTDKGIVTKKFATSMAIGKSIATSSINFVSSNYGNYTGDYVTQAKINTAMTMASDFGTLAIAGVVGGPAGLIMASTSLLISKSLQQANVLIERRKQDIETNALRERMGLIGGDSR